MNGDQLGKAIVENLQKEYSTWPGDHFRTWAEKNFEHYYPEQFQEQAKAVLARPHDEKPEQKRKLLDTVRKWVEEVSREDAMKAFQTSAEDVIELLREIDRSLFEQRT